MRTVYFMQMLHRTLHHHTSRHPECSYIVKSESDTLHNTHPTSGITHLLCLGRVNLARKGHCFSFNDNTNTIELNIILRSSHTINAWCGGNFRNPCCGCQQCQLYTFPLSLMYLVNTDWLINYSPQTPHYDNWTHFAFRITQLWMQVCGHIL